MAVYKVPSHSPHERRLWLFSVSACLFLIGVALFSFFEPPGISDSVAHSIGWAAGAVTLTSVVGLIALSVKEETLKLKQKLRFEISDGRIIKTSDDGITVEIPLNNVESIHEYSSWLLIRGGEPIRQIAVPREISDFEVLKGELASYHPITVSKATVYPFSFLPVILLIVAWFLLLTSDARLVVVVAGIAALGLQAIGVYSLLAVLRGKKKLKFIALMLVFTWLLIAGIVFQRVKSVW